jgi:hypothetical protein
MKCIHPNTSHAFVNDEQVAIESFNQGVPYCKHGHLLCSVQGTHNKWHFRHASSSDVSSPLSEWHAEWQLHFDHTEIWFDMVEGQHSRRRADIVEGNYVVEIQHSSILKEEVDNRNHDYALYGKKVIWVIDGSDITINGDILTIDHIWKYDSFLNCAFIYINIEDKVYKINPNSIKSLTVHVLPIHKSVFIQSIKTQCVYHETPFQNKIYLKQQGAGNGKTWGIIQMLAREEFQHYKRFIYVTKQHSARVILKEEFRIQQSELGFTNISDIKEKNKKFIIDYTNRTGIPCSIIIATIDSFMYAVGDKHVNANDKFQGITKSVVEGHLDADIRGTIQYAGVNPKLNAETLYIIDEAQDLKTYYADAVLQIMKKTNMDVYVVGDKLQSISNELNAFTTFQPFAICEEPKNECRRFIHPQLIDFVNYMIPFEKYGLLPITPYKQCEDTTTAVYPMLAKMTTPYTIDIEDTVDKIIHSMEKEVQQHGYVPENFLIVLPFVSINPLATILEIAINDFWIRILNPEQQLDPYWKNHKVDEYYRYCIFHKSEEGTSINLDESARSTRMVSIHASKGDGREVVFVIGVTDSGLKVYSGIKDTLRYDSLLHVAITRMKRSLYIVYVDDAIGRSIMAWLHKTGQDFEVKTINIDSTIKVKNIYDLNGEQLNSLVDLEYRESSGTTQVIDMSHHNIRFGILIEQVRELLEDQEGKHQIKTQKRKSCDLPIQTWHTWKDYNFRVKLNGGFTDKDGNRQQEYSIPLLKINEGIYNRYLDIIKQHMQRLRVNITKCNTLCPFEMIILFYMNQITQKHYKSQITMTELYNIVDVYEKAFKHHFKGHEHCLCKQTFYDNENKNSFSEYLNSHYEQMFRVEKLVKKMLDTYPKTDWNVDHYIKYIDCPENSRFTIRSQCHFIGYDKTHVILCYVTPNLTTLNVNNFKITAMLDLFIVKQQHESTENYLKYNNKKIIVCIIAINLDEPYYMNVEVDDTTMKKVIASSMYDYYSFLNKEVYYFYQTYRKKYEPKSFIQKCITNWSEFKKETKSTVPKYVDGFMDDVNRQGRRKDASTFVKELDESFIDKLNDELKYSISEFLQGIEF